MWDLIVSVPDHCSSIYFAFYSMFLLWLIIIVIVRPVSTVSVCL